MFANNQRVQFCEQALQRTVRHKGAEEVAPGAKLNLAPVGKVAALYDAILTRHFKDTFKSPKIRVKQPSSPTRRCRNSSRNSF